MEYPRLGLIRIEHFDHFLADALGRLWRLVASSQGNTVGGAGIVPIGTVRDRRRTALKAPFR
jgi:hypothetical protein